MIIIGQMVRASPTPNGQCLGTSLTACFFNARSEISTIFEDNWVIVVCIECPIVLCRCYLGVFVIDRTVFWFVLLSIVHVIVFSEVISTVECLCSWGIWGGGEFFSTL